MNKQIVEVIALTKTYKSRNFVQSAVDNLTFSINRGEIFGLIGPNGAGKTTTIKLLLGLLRADKGKIRIFGVDNRNLEIKRMIGYLPENPAYPSYLTGYEFLEYMGLLYKIDPKILKDKIKSVSEILNIAKFGNRKIFTYSKGMIQRLFLAQALISDPELLILDEPTTGLDPIGIIDFRNIAMNLKKDEKSILISSHNLTELEKICDTVAFMKEGKIIETLNLSSMRDWKKVEILLSKINIDLLERLKKHNFIYEVKDEIIIFRVKDEIINSIVKEIDELGYEIKSIKTNEISLEDLFIEFVMRK